MNNYQITFRRGIINTKGNSTPHSFDIVAAKHEPRVKAHKEIGRMKNRVAADASAKFHRYDQQLKTGYKGRPSLADALKFDHTEGTATLDLSNYRFHKLKDIAAHDEIWTLWKETAKWNGASLNAKVTLDSSITDTDLRVLINQRMAD
jgi:hypothetical protein